MRRQGHLKQELEQKMKTYRGNRRVRQRDIKTKRELKRGRIE